MQKYRKKNKKSRVLTPNGAMNELTANKYIQEVKDVQVRDNHTVTISRDVGLRIVIATFCVGVVIGLYI